MLLYICYDHDECSKYQVVYNKCTMLRAGGVNMITSNSNIGVFFQFRLNWYLIDLLHCRPQMQIDFGTKQFIRNLEVNRRRARPEKQVAIPDAAIFVSLEILFDVLCKGKRSSLCQFTIYFRDSTWISLKDEKKVAEQRTEEVASNYVSSIHLLWKNNI